MTEYNIPATLAACADRLQDLKKQRLAQQKIVDELVREEGVIAQHLKDSLPLEGSTGVSGMFARVSLVEKIVPTVTDWASLHAHIQRTGDFDLLQRRVSDTAVKERWAAGDKVDGVGEFTAVTLSINKV